MKRLKEILIFILAIAILAAFALVLRAQNTTSTNLQSQVFMNSLWVQINGVSNGVAYLTIHGTTNGMQYEISSKAGLANGTWNSEGLIWGGETTNLTTTTVALNGRANLFFRAQSLSDTGDDSSYMLMMDSLPSITTQPTNQTVMAGGNVTFSVGATGTGYQWQRNGSNLPGANSSTLTLTNVNSQDAGIYTVVVSNVFGSVTSTYAALRVLNPCSIVAWGDNTYGQTNIPPGLTNAVAVAGGWQHSLALKSDGTVVAWGDNTYGQTNVPAGLTNVVAVAGGYYHSVALKDDGTVVAWGDNQSGETTVPSNLTNAVAISAIGTHSLALKSDGTVVGWGESYFGEISIPTGLTNVMAVAGGGLHSLALKSDGTVVAWGYNGYGETNVPSNLTNVVAIAGGYFHSLAVKGDGTVVAWGVNNEGETNVPSSLTNAVEVAGGWLHSLALKSDGTVVAWENNDYGQTNIPSGLMNVVAIAAGGMHNLALFSNSPPVITAQPQSQTAMVGSNATFTVTATGTGYQWRRNGFNLINSGRISGADTSTLTLTNVNPWDSGIYTVVVSNTDGNIVSTYAMLRVWVPSRVVAWGTNYFGLTNVPSLINVPSGLTNAVAVAGGCYFHSLAVKNDGTVVAWGDDTYGETNVPSGLTNAVAVAAGFYHSLALKSDGTVVTWGDDRTADWANSLGQANVPAGLTNAVAIAAGFWHDLALKSDGTVVAWGINGWGQTNVPSGLTNVVAIAGGGIYSLALKGDGTVVAWGDNGDGETNVPSGLTNVVAIAAGFYHDLALKSDGTVVAWGYNGQGETNVPSGLTNVVAIAGGGYYSLALKGDGTVVAWGDNWQGETNVPSGLTNVVAIAGGGYYGLALGSLPPSITTQPINQTVIVGSNATFTVTATGTLPLRYRWYFNETNVIDGATNSSLTLTNVQTTNAGNYSVVITNIAGSMTSSNALLIVYTPIADAGNMVVYFPYESANTNLVNAIVENGLAASMAILVNSTNFSGASWMPFSTTPLVNLGTNDGTYEVWFGFKGTNGIAYWSMASVTLDTTPPVLVITNLATRSGSRPFIDPAGYATKALNVVNYVVVDANGVTNSGQGLVVAQTLNSADMSHTTNWIEYLDLALAPGTNWISLQATDWAGNVTATNFTYVFDTNDDITAPAITLVWPQNETQISGNNFTVQGRLDDDTATVALQYTDTNGTVQTINGLVERGGNIWVENVPLSAGTNHLSIIATDAAGNVSAANISIIQSSLILIVTPLSDEQMQSAYATVQGTVSDTNCGITVNGIQGVNNGDGTWEVDNVPIPPGGTVTLQATAQPNDDIPTQMLLAQDRGPVVFTQTFGYKLQYNDWFGTPGVTNRTDVFQASFQWARGAGGKNTSHWVQTSFTYNPPWVSDSEGTTIWPADNGYTPTLSGYAGNTSNIVPPPSVEWMEQSVTNGTWVINSNGINSGVIFSESSQREVRLFTGGKAVRQRQSLFDLSAGLKKEGRLNPDVPNWPVYFYSGRGPFLGTVADVPSTQISLGALGNLGSDGHLWTALPDGREIVITPKAPTPSFTGSLPSQQKYKSYFTAYAEEPNPGGGRNDIISLTQFTAGHCWWRLSSDAPLIGLQRAGISIASLAFLNDQVGYFPLVSLSSIFTPEPGILKDPGNGGRIDAFRRFQIGFNDLKSGLGFTANLASNPGTYSLYLYPHNCVTTTVQAGAFSGVTLPNDVTPQSFGVDLNAMPNP